MPLTLSLKEGNRYTLRGSIAVASLGGTAPDDTLQGGDTRAKIKKSDSSDEQKKSPVFFEKINRGNTAELAKGDD